MKVGINGWGRIGRCLARQILDAGEHELIKINGSGDEFTNNWLLEHDSVHGRWKNNTSKDVEWSNQRDIYFLDWNDCDVVFECTGAYNDGTVVKQHLYNGAKKVLISAPAINVDNTIVFGVNQMQLSADDKIVSAASCTTNCLAPIINVLHRNFGIESAQMTTIHSYTGDQVTVDRRHKDLYRARAALQSIIPTSTGATQAIEEIFPDLAGKIAGSAVRVPTPNVSAVDLSFVTDRKVTVDEINNCVYNDYIQGGIIEYDEGPKVSIDFNTTEAPCIFAPQHTRVAGKLARVFCWYDNEWSYASQMIKTATQMGKV